MEKKSAGPGRPTNADRLGRCSSSHSLDSYVKRKREDDGGTEEERMDRMMDAESTLGKVLRKLTEGQRKMFEEVAKLRAELVEKDEKWGEEKLRMEQTIDGLRGEVRVLKSRNEALIGTEERVRVAGGRGVGREGEVIGGVAERVIRVEKKLEAREREDRRKNLIISGISGNEGNIRDKVEEVVGIVRQGIHPVEVRNLSRGERSGRVWVRFENERDRNEVKDNSYKLRGRQEWLEDDLTWEERRIQWKLRRLAAKMSSEGKRVRVGNGRMWVEGKWWRWIDETEELRDTFGRRWGERRAGDEREGEEEEEVHVDMENTMIG